MGVWFLQAKRFVSDQRSEAATSATFWFSGPGTYTIGRNGCDINILEDRSISRLHAKLHISENDKVTLCNHGRFGTTASAENDLDHASQVSSTDPVQIHSRYFLKFGHMSPFRLYHRPILLLMPSASQQLANPEAWAALCKDVAATGLAFTEDPTVEGVKSVILSEKSILESASLLVLLLQERQMNSPSGGGGQTVVPGPFWRGLLKASWVSTLARRRIWQGQLPPEVDHKAHSHDVFFQNVLVPGSSPSTLMNPASSVTQVSQRAWSPDILCPTPLPCAPEALMAGKDNLFVGTTFLWLPGTRDAHLMKIVELLGGKNVERALNSRAAVPLCTRAVLVCSTPPQPSEPSSSVKEKKKRLPKSIRNLSWTLPELLITSVVKGTLVTVSPSDAADDQGEEKREARQEGEGAVTTSEECCNASEKGKVEDSEQETVLISDSEENENGPSGGLDKRTQEAPPVPHHADREEECQDERTGALILFMPLIVVDSTAPMGRKGARKKKCRTRRRKRILAHSDRNRVPLEVCVNDLGKRQESPSQESTGEDLELFTRDLKPQKKRKL